MEAAIAGTCGERVQRGRCTVERAASRSEALHAKIGQLALENDFHMACCTSRTSAALAAAISNVNVSDLTGNAARGLFVDDGSSS
jgi:hypothetical protein